MINDVNTFGLDGIFAGAFREMGFDLSVIPPFNLDALILFTDEAGFTSNLDGSNGNGFEVIVFSFDATAAVFSNTDVPDPVSLLDNTFFLFQETVNGEFTAAAFGIISQASVPEPATLALFSIGLGGLAIVRRRRRLTVDVTQSPKR